VNNEVDGMKKGVDSKGEFKNTKVTNIRLCTCTTRLLDRAFSVTE